MSKEIIAEFHKGKVTITTKGYKGKECRDVTKSLEEALGTKTSDVDTEEIHEKPVKQARKVYR